MVIDNIQSDTIELQLPAWRPGRYELQNFAKNIQRFEVFRIPSLEGQGAGATDASSGVSFLKLTKDRWLIHTPDLQEITVKFTYFANVQNAGSSYVDESVMYVNFVNCLPYVERRIDEACALEVEAPPAPRGGAFESNFGTFKDGRLNVVFDSPSGGWEIGRAHV